MKDNMLAYVPPALPDDEDSQQRGTLPHARADAEPSLPPSLDADPSLPPSLTDQTRRPGPAAFLIGRPGSIRSDSDGSDFGSTSSLISPLISRMPPRQRDRFILYTPFASASSENSSFPHPTKCIHCSRQLRSREARWGTGLCDPCYVEVDKVCQCCHTRLALRQLHWNSGLCNRCYDSCEKMCR